MGLLEMIVYNPQPTDIWSQLSLGYLKGRLSMANAGSSWWKEILLPGAGGLFSHWFKEASLPLRIWPPCPRRLAYVPSRLRVDMRNSDILQHLLSLPKQVNPWWSRTASRSRWTSRTWAMRLVAEARMRLNGRKPPVLVRAQGVEFIFPPWSQLSRLGAVGQFVTWQAVGRGG